MAKIKQNFHVIIRELNDDTASCVQTGHIERKILETFEPARNRMAQRRQMCFTKMRRSKLK